MSAAVKIFTEDLPLPEFVEVALPLPLRQTFTYRLPTGLQENVKIGARLLVPAQFVGLGDMSRGGLLLRCVREQRELDYIAVSEIA